MKSNRRLGLALTGGGITGAMYEVGVLAALEDFFEDFSASDFDVFVGSGTGAPVTALLAGGLSAQRLYRGLLDPGDDFFPLKRQHLLRFDSRELTRVVRATLGASRRALGAVIHRPLDLDPWQELDRFVDSLPAGLFSLERFERFLEELFTRRGVAPELASLPATLRLVANDIDTGERVVFGAEGAPAVSLARAVTACCSIPVLYQPMRVDGRDVIAATGGEAGHVDIAAGLGCEQLFVINTMVPVRVAPEERNIPTGHGKRRRVRDKGLLGVYNQSLRLITEANLERGLESYRRAHPDLGVHLIEPARDDAVMFMHSPMSFAARRLLLEHGYTSTTRSLREELSPLRMAFEHQGLKPGAP